MSAVPSFPSSSGSDKIEPVLPGPVAPAKEPDALTELNASRARLRNALRGIAHPPKQPSLLSNGLDGIGEQLLQRARAMPGANAVLKGIRAWWQKSPARRGANLAGPTAAPLLSSIGRKKPQALLLTSAAVGALAMIAPWRLLVFRLFRPALLPGILFEVVKASMRRPGNAATSTLNHKETP